MRNHAFRIVLLSLFLVIFVVPGAWGEEAEMEFLLDFLPGQYQVIGRHPDSKELYSGAASVERQGESLKVVRRIGSEVAEGLGGIETSMADAVKVLRVRFQRGGVEYEATYVIGYDLDNYARLTGYVYLANGTTRQPGLEALFIDFPSRGEGAHPDSSQNDSPPKPAK